MTRPDPFSPGRASATSQRPDDAHGDRKALDTRVRLATGMAVFGSATPVSKIVTGAMPVFVASTIRVALGAVALLPIAFRHRDVLRSIDRATWGRIGLIALFGMVGFTAFLLFGMQLVPGVVGAIVMSTAPAVTAAGAMLFLGDAPTWRKVLAIVLAVGGVLLLHVGGGVGGEAGGRPVLGSLLVFAAVCCEAVYTLVGKRVSSAIDPSLAAFLAAAASIPLFGILVLIDGRPLGLEAVPIGAWIALVWYGAGTLALGTWLWYSGVARTEGMIAAAFMGVMPASALVLSYVLLGEPFRWIHLLGFGVVFAGVLLVSWEHARMEKHG